MRGRGLPSLPDWSCTHRAAGASFSAAVPSLPWEPKCPHARHYCHMPHRVGDQHPPVSALVQEATTALPAGGWVGYGSRVHMPCTTSARPKAAASPLGRDDTQQVAQYSRMYSRSTAKWLSCVAHVCEGESSECYHWLFRALMGPGTTGLCPSV